MLYSLSGSFSSAPPRSADWARRRKRTRSAGGCTWIYGRAFDFVIKLWSKRAAAVACDGGGCDVSAMNQKRFWDATATVLPPQPTTIATTATVPSSASSSTYIYLCGQKRVNHINYGRV